MNILTSVSDTVFELNGIKYLKNYISNVYGNKIEIYNCYERADVLIPQTHYQNFMVNGSTFSSAVSLQAALLTILFSMNAQSNTNFPDATVSTKGKLQLAGDLSGTAAAPTVPALSTKVPIEVPTVNENIISFTSDRIYGTPSNPITSNITINLTGAKYGVTNMIIHNSSSPLSLNAPFKKYVGSQDYIPSKNNFIYMVYLNNETINYLIQHTL